MKKSLLAGLVILLPIAITVAVAVYLFDIFTSPFYGLMRDLLLQSGLAQKLHLTANQEILIIVSRIIVFVLLLCVLFFVGLAARRYFFRQLMELLNHIFSKIPFIKTIYKILNETMKATFRGDEKKFFQKTILAPFPFEKTHAFGFVTAEVPERLKKRLDVGDTAIFVPTAPHPISGFTLLIDSKELKDVDMTVEETFKFLISCGVVFPEKED